MNSNHFIKKACIAILSNFDKRNKKIWLFGEWFGKRCGDNSLYLANYVAQKHPDIHVFFAANKDTDLSLLDKRIKVIDRTSRKSIAVYRRAGVVVMNQGIQDFMDDPYNYFSGAVTVNLWHGVPWKKIFLDSSKNTSFLGKMIDRIAMVMTRSKYYLSLSEDFTRIIRNSTGVKDKNIIKSGYPRNSIFYDDEVIKTAKGRIIDALKKNGADINDKTRLITYMPTFRDSGAPTFSFNEMDESFFEYLRTENIVLVEKNHFADINKMKDSIRNRVINLPDCNAPELLAASDMLITDYSSCFFDYLVLDRPIIHFIYDYEDYSTKDRGVYYSKDEVVCGDTAMDTRELFDSIKRNISDPNINQDLRNKRREVYITYENEDSCKQIYDFIRGVL